MGDELLRRQAQNGVNFDFEVKFDLEGQGQSPPKTIGISTKVFYTYGSNLVILAWTGDELSRGQTWWRTDGRTDAGNDNTRRPILASGKNWLEQLDRYIPRDDNAYNQIHLQEVLIGQNINVLISRPHQVLHMRTQTVTSLYWQYQCLIQVFISAEMTNGIVR